MDFVDIKTTNEKGFVVIAPNFRVCKSKDLMTRGGAFYAIWNDETGLWSTDEFDVAEIIDKEIYKVAEDLKAKSIPVKMKLMNDFSSNSWKDFQSYLTNQPDNYHNLDETLTFLNDKVKKTSYVSKRLSYSLEDIPIDSYNELMGVLYDEDERAKIEWAIGSIISGDSREIQKFIVLYGEAGTGKSTVLNIIQKLFDGYYTAFEAKALTSSNNSFATEVFKNNPLVAIQHDGDLSKIEDNTKFNSIVSHEYMVMNEKYKSSYIARANCFLFMGSNKPVKITDAKSGLIRRLIDVKPTGNRLSPKKYNQIMHQINFEIPGIAKHCLDVYNSMGPDYYSSYKPTDMILQTNVFYNFVEANYFLFEEQDGTSLTAAYEMYKNYCDETLVEYKMPRHIFREELKAYFKNFDEITRIDGKQVRSYYSGFLTEKFKSFLKVPDKKEINYKFVLNSDESIFDKEFSTCKAQYCTKAGTPLNKWENVNTYLKDIDTRELHYVLPPSNLIVIDFDKKDKSGNKSLALNLQEAENWPLTYAECSKSGEGLHLHYYYDGDISELSSIYSECVEVKVFNGNSSLRRKLSKCNKEPIAIIPSGCLPKKEKKKVVNFNNIKNEKAIRTIIEKNLRKEYHGYTKPSIDYIYDTLEKAYSSGVSYDVTDLLPAIMAFANNSTNNAEYCLEKVSKMKFKSDKEPDDIPYDDEKPYVFFDVEVFPNLFILNWKFYGKDKTCVRMINPTPSEIDEFLHNNYRLIGFNCRRYDNHILYARLIGYSNLELFELSQRIINGDKTGFFQEAYNLSYADIYDFSTKKQSLKKFEIDLGIHHKELGYKWDEPVPEDKWLEVAEYCDNDVIATECTFDDRKEDFMARQILAKLSGFTVNDTTQKHTAKIIFGDDPEPQKQFIYTDLSEMFPGYVYDNGKSTYRGEETGEGGYVYAEPGIHNWVALLDISSMHPHSAIALNIFGKYTKNFKDLVDARLAIKHKEYDKARGMLNGVLSEFLNDESQSESLAYALKIVINIVYGLTSATFPNKFRDSRNIDNIVAKRGALFMIDLKHAVQEQGFRVAHIKTDSIKIPDATPEIIQFVMDYGKKYGYTFEHEATYEKMCLVNDAVYIAKVAEGKHKGEWTATGAQFQHPYVFKKLFSDEPIEFKDVCETKAVTSSLYLDMNEALPENEHNYVFIGKVSSFVPVKQGYGGGILYREKDGKYYAATGTKGYRWLEEETVRNLYSNPFEVVDMEYFEKLVKEAIKTINNFGDFDDFKNKVPPIYDLPFDV